MTAIAKVRENVSRLRNIALAVGVAGLLVCAVMALLDPAQFFRSYLLGFLYWWTVSLGCLGLLMLHNLTSGGWGRAIKPFLHAALPTLIPIAVLFVPLTFGLTSLYEWAATGEDVTPLMAHKQQWLNPLFFNGRAAVYFTVWLVLALVMHVWQLKPWTVIPERVMENRRIPSAVGLAALIVTMSFASIDWAMSLEPEWISTMYGGIYVVAGGLSALLVGILGATITPPAVPLGKIRRSQALNDLGNLLLGFLMVWTYFSFSQFLIIWSGNLPEESGWMLKRMHGGWQGVALSLVALHFVVPFGLLMSRDVKRNARWLVIVASLLVVMRFVDLFWTVAPSLYGKRAFIHWLDIVTLVGIGGVWLAVFFTTLGRRLLWPDVQGEPIAEAAHD